MTLQTLQIGGEWFAERPGGLNRVYAHLLTELAQQGVETLGLVAGSPSVVAQANGMVHAFAEASAPVWSRWRAIRAAADPWLRSHGTDAVVVSHFALNAFPLIKRIGTRPFVVHFQGPWGQESLHEGESRVVVMAKEYIERRVYRRADAAIVLSEAFANILAERFSVSRARIHVIPGGVEVHRFANVASRAEARALLGWPADRPIALCVRRLVRRVGLDALIEAAADVRRRVSDVLVLIAGSGPMRDELAARIVDLGLSGSVRLVGFLPDEQLPLAYRAADVTVVPTVALEGFGLIVVESLAAGTPCIVTPVGGLAEIITPFSPSLVTASSTAADIAVVLAGALRGELALPSPEECTTYARTNFDWPVIATKVRAVY